MKNLIHYYLRVNMMVLVMVFNNFPDASNNYWIQNKYEDNIIEIVTLVVKLGSKILVIVIVRRIS